MQGVNPDDEILSAWSAVVREMGERPAILDPRAKVLATFSGVDERARRFEQQSALRDFARGDVVAIQIGNHPDWPPLFLACLRLRLVALPLERTMSTHDRENALRVSGAAGLIVCADDALQINRLTTRTQPDWGQSPPVLLKLTSGTTAAPRVIRFRSRQLLADCSQICDTMGITDRDLNFAVIPLSHSYGFSNLVTPLLTRGVPMAVSRDRMPRAVLDDLARTQATVFPGMPVFFQAFSEMADIPRLQSLRLCISAGAPLRAITASAFQNKFGLPIHSFYGSSECGGICYDRAAINNIDGFVGPPLSGVDVEFLDSSSAGSRIRVRSQAVGDGYFPEPDETTLGSGMFVADDLVAKMPDGLQIVGRVSDLINVAGKKVNPYEVEAQLLEFPGIEQAAVFGRESALRNQEVAACVLASGGVRESDLLEFCRTRLSGWQVPKRIFFVDKMPISERGKISRRELAARFALDNNHAA
jgi:long-chain acyl-CoA synthetase